jgi:hypothetical protein
MLASWVCTIVHREEPQMHSCSIIPHSECTPMQTSRIPSTSHQSERHVSIQHYSSAQVHAEISTQSFYNNPVFRTPCYFAFFCLLKATRQQSSKEVAQLQVTTSRSGVETEQRSQLFRCIPLRTFPRQQNLGDDLIGTRWLVSC